MLSLGCCSTCSYAEKSQARKGTGLKTRVSSQNTLLSRLLSSVEIGLSGGEQVWLLAATLKSAPALQGPCWHGVDTGML